jgi:predicted metal-dependent hydrolase
MSTYEPLYIDYLIYFNRDQDYFECHEVLEELWLERDRDSLYKGLLQIAVGLYHFRNGNLRGGMMMLQSSVDLLEPYPDMTLGIELGGLVQEVKELVKELSEADAQSVTYRDLSIRIVDEALEQEMLRRSLELKPNIPQRRSPTRGRIYEEKKMKAIDQGKS